MLNMYERVLGSRNETTLIMLSLVVVFALLIQGYLDATRADILRRASVKFDREVAGPTFDAIQRAITRAPLDRNIPSLRDLDIVREFIASPALSSLMDAIWFPIFLIVCFAVHPVIALIVLATGGLVALLTYLTSRTTAEPIAEATKANGFASRRANSSFQNYEPFREWVCGRPCGPTGRPCMRQRLAGTLSLMTGRYGCER